MGELGYVVRTVGTRCGWGEGVEAELGYEGGAEARKAGLSKNE